MGRRVAANGTVVQEVTGHKTTDMVLKDYFQPGREGFRQTVQSAVPKLPANGHKTPKEEMRELLTGLGRRHCASGCSRCGRGGEAFGSTR